MCHQLLITNCVPPPRDGFVVDKDDSSLTRSNTYMLQLFEQAGVQVGVS